MGHEHLSAGETHCCGCLLSGVLLAVISICVWIFYQRSQVCRYYIRITAFYASIFLAGFFSMFGAIPTYFFNGGAVAAMVSLNFLCRWWIDIDVEVRGREKITAASGPDDKPLLMVSNHQSSLDVYVMSKFWPSKSVAMLKSSLKYIPFFGFSAMLCNSIFVNRFNKESAHQTVQKAVDLLHKKRLKLYVFPEGTRHHGHGMLPFKKGAFNIAVQAQIDIVPIAISDLRPFYSKSGTYFHSNGKIIVQIMDPVSTRGLTHDDVPALSERIREQMIKVYDEISIEAEKKYAAAIGTSPNAKSENNKKSN